MTNMTRIGLLVVSGLLLAAVGGCDNNKITASKVRSDMSPELDSIAMTKEQRKNEHARTVDTDLRQVWDDLDMLLLLDRPVRLSRYPIP